MKTNSIVHSSTFNCLLLCVTWFTLVGSSYAGTWVSLRTDMKGNHTPHSGSSSKEVHQRWLEIELSAMGRDEAAQVRLRWSFFADDLDAEKPVEHAKGSELVELAPGKAVIVKTKEVTFEYTRQHSEKISGGRRPRYKNVKATGKRYHGWAVRAYIGDDLVGEAFSNRDIAKLTVK